MEKNYCEKEISIEEQKILLLEMMDDIHEFCEKNGIRYFLTGGTLLGAIRHGGFIPWDDDVDIAMFRKDYDKFICFFNQQKNAKYKVEDCRNKKYRYPFAKVIDTRTRLIEQIDEASEIGAYIDVFPVDFCGNNIEKAYKLFLAKIKPLIAMNLIKIVKDNKSRSALKRFVLVGGKLILKPVSCECLVQKIDKVARKINDRGASKYCAVISVLTYGKREIMETKWYSDVVKLQFEDREYCGPIGYEQVLSHLYGDYMKLPPKEKQKTHHDYKLYWK